MTRSTSCQGINYRLRIFYWCIHHNLAKRLTLWGENVKAIETYHATQCSTCALKALIGRCMKSRQGNTLSQGTHHYTLFGIAASQTLQTFEHQRMMAHYHVTTTGDRLIESTLSDVDSKEDGMGLGRIVAHQQPTIIP